jgi:hypothetical protein
MCVIVSCPTFDWWIDCSEHKHAAMWHISSQGHFIFCIIYIFSIDSLRLKCSWNTAHMKLYALAGGATNFSFLGAQNKGTVTRVPSSICKEYCCKTRHNELNQWFINIGPSSWSGLMSVIYKHRTELLVGFDVKLS